MAQVLEEPRYQAGEDEAELMYGVCLGAGGTLGLRGTRAQNLRLPGPWWGQSHSGAIQGILEPQGEELSSGSWIPGERQVLLSMAPGAEREGAECPGLSTSTLPPISPSALSIGRPEGHGTWEGSLRATQSRETSWISEQAGHGVFPGGPDGKVSACNVGKPRFDP